MSPKRESAAFKPPEAEEPKMSAKELAQALEDLRQEEDKLKQEQAAAAALKAEGKKLSPKQRGDLTAALEADRAELQRIEEWMQTNPEQVTGTEFAEHRILAEKIREAEMKLGLVELPEEPKAAPAVDIKPIKEIEAPSLEELTARYRREAEGLAPSVEAGEETVEAEYIGLVEQLEGLKDQIKELKEAWTKTRSKRKKEKITEETSELQKEVRAINRKLRKYEKMEERKGLRKKVKELAAEIPKEELKAAAGKVAEEIGGVVDVGEGSPEARAAAAEVEKEMAVEEMDRAIAELPPVLLIQDSKGNVYQGYVYDRAEGKDKIAVLFGSPEKAYTKKVDKADLLRWQTELLDKLQPGERSAYEKRYLSRAEKRWEAEPEIESKEMTEAEAREFIAATAEEVKETEEYDTLMEQLREITEKGDEAEMQQFINDLEAEARTNELNIQDAAQEVLKDLQIEEWFSEGESEDYTAAADLAESLGGDVARAKEVIASGKKFSEEYQKLERGIVKEHWQEIFPGATSVRPERVNELRREIIELDRDIDSLRLQIKTEGKKRGLLSKVLFRKPKALKLLKNQLKTTTQEQKEKQAVLRRIDQIIEKYMPKKRWQTKGPARSRGTGGPLGKEL